MTHFAKKYGGAFVVLAAALILAFAMTQAIKPVTASYIQADLTNLNASNLTSGTVPDARFPATLPAASGANLTALNASNLTSGTVPLARLSGITKTELATPITTIASGNLSGTTTSITSIPATYSYLVLQITGASSDTGTRQMWVRVSTDNGSNYDSTTTNYVSFKQTASAVATVGTATLVDSATITAAQSFTATIVIECYQGGPNMRWTGRILQNTTNYTSVGTYIGSTNAINALQMLWDASGSFDAGTYTLYGVR